MPCLVPSINQKRALFWMSSNSSLHNFLVFVLRIMTMNKSMLYSTYVAYVCTHKTGAQIARVLRLAACSLRPGPRAAPRCKRSLRTRPQAGSMCRRAGYCRLDVPACRPAGWFRDRVVIPDGLVRSRRRGTGNRRRGTGEWIPHTCATTHPHTCIRCHPW